MIRVTEAITEQQVVQTLREIRFSPALERQRQTLPSLRSIATQSGVSCQTLYRIIRKQRTSMDVLERIAPVITRLRQRMSNPTLSALRANRTGSALIEREIPR